MAAGDIDPVRSRVHTAHVVESVGSDRLSTLAEWNQFKGQRKHAQDTHTITALSEHNAAIHDENVDSESTQGTTWAIEAESHRTG